MNLIFTIMNLENSCFSFFSSHIVYSDSDNRFVCNDNFLVVPLPVFGSNYSNSFCISLFFCNAPAYQPAERRNPVHARPDHRHQYGQPNAVVAELPPEPNQR